MPVFEKIDPIPNRGRFLCYQCGREKGRVYYGGLGIRCYQAKLEEAERKRQQERENGTSRSGRGRGGES